MQNEISKGSSKDQIHAHKTVSSPLIATAVSFLVVENISVYFVKDQAPDKEMIKCRNSDCIYLWKCL